MPAERLPIYVWADNKVICVEDLEIFPTHLMHKYCVDTAFVDIHYRYGIVEEERNWATISKDEFPKEFLLALILLGVI